MVGFISYLAPLLNYLRRQSPGPKFPPDFRQAGERGAKTPFGRCWCAAMTIAPWIALTAALASAARGGKEAAYGPRAPPPLTRCEASTKCVCAGVYDNWLYERMSGYVYYSSARGRRRSLSLQKTPTSNFISGGLRQPPNLQGGRKRTQDTSPSSFFPFPGIPGTGTTQPHLCFLMCRA